MQIAPANTQITFEVTFDDPSLPVAMSVYDTSGSSPSLVAGPTAMTNVSGTNSYIGKFTPGLGIEYMILKAVYTDGTFETFSPNYSQGSESIISLDQGGGGGGESCGAVIGIVNIQNSLIGLVNC